MKVKMLSRYAGPKGSFSVGQEVDVSSKEADDLISGGFAVPVKKNIEASEDNLSHETAVIRRKSRK